ncbi:MAG: type IV secretion system DNA-binding domain-containing protein [Candidatus Spechtbacterales bacterium]
MEEINYFGQLNYRGRSDRFGIKTDDRRRHMYIIGKTGMGKTNMIQNMAIQDIINGNGLGILDPHGEFAETLLSFVPPERMDDVVYFNPADADAPMGLNLLEDVGYNQRHLVASGLMGVFKKIWVDVWSARMEYILNNTILALLEYPDATLLDVNRMMANKNFRNEVLSYVKDPIVRSFWLEEFAKYSDRLASEATASIQNKIGQFTTAPLIRNIVGQKVSTIDMRKIMDDGKIFIMNLSKGRIGEDNSRLLGAMAITKLYLAAMSRIDTPEAQRRDFFLYVDEFQNFASEAFEGILSEARKYRLCLILAHQYIAQMDEEVRDAVFGNIGTFITFRVGAEDAEHIEKEFTPEFMVDDLVNLPKFNIALKLMIDGITHRAFAARTIAPLEPGHAERLTEEIIKRSRDKYGTSRQEMEKVIQEWDVSTKMRPVTVPAKKAQEQKENEKPISMSEAMQKFPAPNLNKNRPPSRGQSSLQRGDGPPSRSAQTDSPQQKPYRPPSRGQSPIQRGDGPPAKKPQAGDGQQQKKPQNESKPPVEKKNSKNKKGPDNEGLRDLLKDIGVIGE